MLYRRFGRTGIDVSVFTCGGMRFQHSWKKTETPTSDSIKKVESIVQRALELGVNHFETANAYGTSEEELGCVFKNIPRNSFYIQTKVTIKEDSSEFLKQFEESLQALQLDYVDFFSLHGINNEEKIHHSLKKDGCLEVAMRLKEEGRVRNIGFSTHGTPEVIIKAMQSDGFDYVNLHWFYIFQDNLPALLEAAKRDIGVLIISPNDKGGMLYKPSEKLRRLTAPLSPMVFNELFCLSRPEITTVTVGASCPEDFDEHMRVVENYDKSSELLPVIVNRLSDEFNAVLGKDWASTWRDGLPLWSETPGEINIPVILHLWNLARAYDMFEYGKMRFNLMGNGEHWFPGGQPENIEKYDFSECLRKSVNANIIPQILKEAYAALAGDEVKRMGSH